jgi:hypothetical protein
MSEVTSVRGGGGACLPKSVSLNVLMKKGMIAMRSMMFDLFLVTQLIQMPLR